MENNLGESQDAAERRRRSLCGKRHRKSQGDLAELAFMLKAASLGLQLAKPWGENGRYDVIIDSGKKLWRIQVKSTTKFDGYCYRIGTHWGTSRRCPAYTAEQVDFLAAYVIPKDIWYILPVEAFTPRKTAALYPHRGIGHGKYEKYREAWDLLT